MNFGFGRNIKFSTGFENRDATRLALEQGLGGTLTPFEKVDLFRLPDGCSIGAFYVPADQALTPAQYELAPWLEFLVDDIEAADARLLAHGVARVEFSDLTHHYYRLPGGPIFRTARRG